MPIISNPPGKTRVGGLVVGGTSGSVLFVDSTGNLAQDNPLFFWDDTNNRLGLGTTAPLGKLDIFTGVTDAVTLSFARTSSAATKASWFSLDSVDNTVFTTTNAEVNFKTNWNSGFPLSTLWLGSTGLVGMGTTSNTEARLKIIPIASSSKGLVVQGASSQSANLQEWQNSAGTALVVVSAGGQVGIGTTNPNQGLQVVSNDSDGAFGAFTTTSGRGITFNPSLTAGIVDIYADYLGGSEPKLHLSTFSNKSGAGGITIDTSGNVGIGTTSPSEILHVYKSGQANLLLESTSTNDSRFRLKNGVIDFWHYINSTGAYAMFDNTAGKTRLGIGSTGGITIPNSTASVIALTVQGAVSQSANLQEWQLSNGTKKVWVDGDGELRLADYSIGNNTLLLGDNFHIYSYGSSTEAWLETTGSSVLNLYARGGTIVTAPSSSVKPLILRGASSQSANLFELQNSSGTALSVFDSAGKLGVGISSSLAGQLHVYRSGSDDTAQFENAGSMAVYFVAGGGGLASFNFGPSVNRTAGRFTYNTSTNSLLLYTNSVERLSFSSTGSTVFNETGADSDFRIEGDTKANLFFVDASADRIEIDGRFVYKVSTLTINDDGTPAVQPTGTLTPTTSYAEITCNDGDGCILTISETGATQGQVVTVVNVGSNTITIDDTSGTVESTGATLSQYGSASFIYMSDRWIQTAVSAN